MAGRRPRLGRLAVAIAAVASCGPTLNPPQGLLATPAGLALAGETLLISNQDNDELRAYRTRTVAFVNSPIALFPLSIPTVRRPGTMCADARQAYVASSVDPLVGVVDAVDDPTDFLPASGLRELGQVAIPGVASALVCAPSPAAVTAHEVAVAGSPEAYAAALASGTLSVDAPGGTGTLADGGPDERHALASLPASAIAAISQPDAPTAFYEIHNDVSGAACPDAGPVETCAPGADASVCPGPSSFCPSVAPLFALPPQPADCAPVGPPLSVGFDVSGSGPGTENLGEPTVDPSTANRLVAGDRHSSCVAAVNLDHGQVRWLPATGPTTAVTALPYLPGSCLGGGTVFAAALDSENCERNGPPPPGGYNDCNGVVFFNPVAAEGDPNPLHARLPAPLPYPFQRSSDHPMPPVRIGGIVQQLAFTGPGLHISQFSPSLSTPVPLEEALIAGTAEGDLFYVDLGFGWADGGTGPDADGGFGCPPAYLAPRLLDANDYVPSPVLPAISNVAVTDGAGTALAGFSQNADQPVTDTGAALPTADRLAGPFPTGAAACWGYTGLWDVCLTAGMVQHGVANDESFSVIYQGAIGVLSGVAGNLRGNVLESSAGVDLTAYAGGALTAAPQNLLVSVTAAGADCGDFPVAAVSPSSLSLVTPIGGPPPGCTGSVTFTVRAGGSTPYVVAGAESGFVGLWPADGSLHLVKTGRWQYPANLIAMGKGAQQLADLVFGPQPTSPAPGSSLSLPRPEDYDALDSAFALAVRGVPVPGAGADGGMADAGLPFTARGAAVTFAVSSGVQPVFVNPEDASALIDAMASYIDTGGLRHVYAAYRGNNALVELNPEMAIFSSLIEEH